MSYKARQLPYILLKFSCEAIYKQKILTEDTSNVKIFNKETYQKGSSITSMMLDVKEKKKKITNGQ